LWFTALGAALKAMTVLTGAVSEISALHQQAFFLPALCLCF